MADVKRYDTITALGREAWNLCFPGELEDYNYFLAVERAAIPGFRHAYYAMIVGEQILCAVPVFFTEYDLATTAQGAIRTLLMGIKRIFPALLTLRLACLGSPETETCQIGMHPSIAEHNKSLLFLELLRFFENDARTNGYSILGLKDVNMHDHERYHAMLQQCGFCGVAGMPTAVLPIDFDSMDDYMARLSAATRKDMRRKLKMLERVRIETRRTIDDVADDILAMYLETREHSDWQFEELTREYFVAALAEMGDQALCTVYFIDDLPAAANLLLIKDGTLLDKFFVMHTGVGRAYNLYFLSWFTNVRLCLERGLKLYQSGQAGYESKLRLGSMLRKNWIYFRHQNRLAQACLRLLSPFLEFNETGHD